MRPRLPLIVCLSTLALVAACSPASDADPAGGGRADLTEAPVAQPAPTIAPTSEPSPRSDPAVAEQGVNDGEPDLTPAPLVPQAERTEKGARNVLLAWARALELKEFDQAWAMFGDEGARSGMTRADYAAQFADLAEISVAVPGGTMEGAAGSSYYSVPTTITGTRRDGTPVTLRGTTVLRRVNDVPGASAAQLHWHLESSDLAPG